MQHLFKALRAARRQDEHMGLGPDQAGLYAALDCFERTNRGHQHELDELAKAACGPVILNTPQERWTRIRTFKSTVDSLVGSVGRAAPKVPGDELFQALWTAQDGTGCLRMRTMDYLPWMLRYHVRLPAGLQLHWLSAQYKDGFGGVEITMTVRNRMRGGLSSPRVTRIECLQPDSLQTAAGVMWGSRQALLEMLERQTWHEFNVDEDLRPRLADSMAFARRVAQESFA